MHYELCQSALSAEVTKLSRGRCSFAHPASITAAKAGVSVHIVVAAVQTFHRPHEICRYLAGYTQNAVAQYGLSSEQITDFGDLRGREEAVVLESSPAPRALVSRVHCRLVLSGSFLGILRSR